MKNLNNCVYIYVRLTIHNAKAQKHIIYAFMKEKTYINCNKFLLHMQYACVLYEQNVYENICVFDFIKMLENLFLLFFFKFQSLICHVVFVLV